MKKRMIVLFALIFAAACIPIKNAPIEGKRQPAPAVLIGAYLYCWTGIEVKEIPEEAASGRIRSVVPSSVVPACRDEANIDCLNAPYVYLDDGIALLLDGKWIFFKPES